MSVTRKGGDSSLIGRVFGVNNKHYASDTFAQLIREQYDDWLNRYYPKQERLMELGTNNELMNA
ncbi:hypothetical protein XS16_005307, partial [Salmonella enterica subsp. enterica serovar Newport]|nr:hypothetical protein [Salmonella enterica subsp. enterica serovar Newport]